MCNHGVGASSTDATANGVRMPDPAMARSGRACDSASHTASMTASTAMKRPPSGMGGRGLSSEPTGTRISNARNVPSLMGTSASMKQRSANSAPETVCDRLELIDAGTASTVPSKSTITWSPSTVTVTTIS